jgi:hypothetical protein
VRWATSNGWDLPFSRREPGPRRRR